jgi:hypothetical protein
METRGQVVGLGRFGKPDFVYLPAEDVYRCPAGEKLTYRYTAEADGQNLRRYWTSACPICPIPGQVQRRDKGTNCKRAPTTFWEKMPATCDPPQR